MPEHILHHLQNEGEYALDRQPQRVVVARMKTRQMSDWTKASERKPASHKKQLLRNASLIAAVSFCLGGGAYVTLKQDKGAQSVMSHMTAGFEFDETLGRLQFVSNILPESAMVFLSSDSSGNNKVTVPAAAQVTHLWDPSEPWIEYAHVGDVFACQSGEVMTIVQNHQDEYTVRLLHNNGYESVYSGMRAVHLKEHDVVGEGQVIGTAAGMAAFELRKDGLSVQPVFNESR